jgi:hypothetical protein
MGDGAPAPGGEPGALRAAAASQRGCRQAAGAARPAPPKHNRARRLHPDESQQPGGANMERGCQHNSLRVMTRAQPKCLQGGGSVGGWNAAHPAAGAARGAPRRSFLPRCTGPRRDAQAVREFRLLNRCPSERPPRREWGKGARRGARMGNCTHVPGVGTRHAAGAQPRGEPRAPFAGGQPAGPRGRGGWLGGVDRVPGGGALPDAAAALSALVAKIPPPRRRATACFCLRGVTHVRCARLRCSRVCGSAKEGFRLRPAPPGSQHSTKHRRIRCGNWGERAHARAVPARRVTNDCGALGPAG